MSTTWHQIEAALAGGPLTSRALADALDLPLWRVNRALRRHRSALLGLAPPPRLRPHRPSSRLLAASAGGPVRPLNPWSPPMTTYLHPSLVPSVERLREMALGLANGTEILADTLPQRTPDAHMVLCNQAARAAARALDCLTHLLDPSAPRPEPPMEEPAPPHRAMTWAYFPMDARLVSEPQAGDAQGTAWPVVVEWQEDADQLVVTVELSEPLNSTGGYLHTALESRWAFAELRAASQVRGAPPIVCAVLRELLARALSADPSLPPLPFSQPAAPKLVEA